MLRRLCWMLGRHPGDRINLLTTLASQELRATGGTLEEAEARVRRALPGTPGTAPLNVTTPAGTASATFTYNP